MTATPEQLAYEEWERVRYPGEPGVEWEHGALSKTRPAWKAAVRVAVDASPELALARQALRDLAELHEHVVEQLATVTAARDEYRDNAILHVRERNDLAARADNLRDRHARILGLFTGNGSGYTARLSGVVLARAYSDGGIELPGSLRHLAGQ